MINERKFNYRTLMFTTLIISGCSIVYEVLISAISSYLLGDSIKQFSITIGLYMSAMGLGSYISKYIRNKLFDWFVFVEIAVGVLGGFCTLILFYANAYFSSYELIMYVQTISIGTLVGLEIPLLTRIVEENLHDLRVTISNIFSFDYIGGLIGSIAFPLILLPKFGYFTTSFLVGGINIFVAVLIVFLYKDYIKNLKLFRVVSIVFLAIMVLGALFSDKIASKLEGDLYRDKVIFTEQTPYQKIVITRHKDDIRLFLDGNIQFSSMDEYRYHESLVHIPLSLLEEKEDILILGGGDGMAVREILKYEEVKSIDLVDIDKDMVELCRDNSIINKLNEGALSSDKVSLIYEDAFKYLERNAKYYDLIIVDLPDPNNDALNKLYTNTFYRLISNSLSKNGIMVVQSTSPYYAKEAFWCINKTLESEGFEVYPYHVQVPSFGDWGFNLAARNELNLEDIHIAVDTKFLNDEAIKSMFYFSKDEIIDKEVIDINSFYEPKLIEYYSKAVAKWN